MLNVLRADDGRWHVGVLQNGVYIRLHLMANGETVSVADAREIAHAILELTEENDG